MGLRRLRCFVVVFVQTVSWVYATTSRHSSAIDASHDLPPGLIKPQPAQYLNSLGFKIKPNVKEEEEEKERRSMGSSPPDCEKKCYGCVPCEATQVPTPTSLHYYSNYVPQGWRCKCGPSFFSP